MSNTEIKKETEEVRHQGVEHIVRRETMTMYKVCSRIIDYMWKDEMEHYLENIERYTEHLSEGQVDILNDELMDFHPYKTPKKISNLIITLMFDSDKKKVGEHIFQDLFILGSYIRAYAEDSSTDVTILGGDKEMSDSEINSRENDHDYVLGLIQKCKEGEE